MSKIRSCSQALDYCLSEDKIEIKPAEIDISALIDLILDNYDSLDSQSKSLVFVLGQSMAECDFTLFSTKIQLIASKIAESEGILSLSINSFIISLPSPETVLTQDFSSLKDEFILHSLLKTGILTKEDHPETNILLQKTSKCLLSDQKMDPKDYSPSNEDEISMENKKSTLEIQLAQSNKRKDIAKKANKKLKSLKDLV